MNLSDRSLPSVSGDRRFPPRAWRVLVIGDLAEACGDLVRAGYDVATTRSALDALAIFLHLKSDFIIAGWSMPDMSGIEFCRAIRRNHLDHFVHLILVFHQPDQTDIARGLEAGMDDFLTTPVTSTNMQARLQVGARRLRQQEWQQQENNRLCGLIGKLREVHDSTERDLFDAGRLQLAMMRDRVGQFGEVAISVALQPAHAVGGDLVGFFPINDHRVGIFSLDIAGHGVAAAVVAARLSAHLSPNPDLNEVLRPQQGGGLPLSPGALARRLNRLLLEEEQLDSYLTLIYADLDHATGRIRMVQAGHPNPVLHAADGSLLQLGRGGMPVGLFPDPDFDEFEFMMRPGERLLIVSDGITEALEQGGNSPGTSQLEELISACAGAEDGSFLDVMLRRLELAGDGSVSDDRSAVLVEYGPPPSRGREGAAI